MNLMQMEELAILEINTGEVHIYTITYDTDVVDFIKSEGFDPECCFWTVNELIKVIKHNAIHTY